jgi:acetylglutamate kinase
LGLKPVIIEGRRVTDDQVLDVVKMVFAGKINVEVLSALRRTGARAVGLSGVDGQIVHAKRRPPRPVKNPQTGREEMVDFGHVGDIERVDTRLLSTLLAGDFIPVLASLGADDDGNIYNINADTLAAHLAASMGAEKFILASNVDGVLDMNQSPPKLLPRLTTQEVRALSEGGLIKGGMLPKTQAAVQALSSGVAAVHIVNGLKPSTLLLEVFTESGSGTMITS